MSVGYWKSSLEIRGHQVPACSCHGLVCSNKLQNLHHQSLHGSVLVSLQCILQVARQGNPLADAAAVAAVRTAVGPSIVLRADANRRWALPEAIAFGRAAAASQLQVCLLAGGMQVILRLPQCAAYGRCNKLSLVCVTLSLTFMLISHPAEMHLTACLLYVLALHAAKVGTATALQYTSLDG